MFEILLLAALAVVVWKIKGPSKKWRKPRNKTHNNITPEKEAANTPQGKVEHKKSIYLTTENERKLYFALQKALPDKYVIHCQVSLMSLIQPVDRKKNSSTWAKRMDFVITDKATKILAVIELDDWTHKQHKRQQRDRYVEESLEGHHPLVRFETQRFYDPSDVAKALTQKTDIQCNSFSQVQA